MAQIQHKIWIDEDGAQLWVQKGFRNGKIIVDTDPDGPRMGSTVELTPRQVDELIKFVRPNA